LGIVEAWKRAAPESRRVVVLNNTVFRAPWADVLYACDLRWWLAYGAEIESFKGERWSCSRHDWVNYIEAVDDPGLSANPNRIHTGGNGGYQAVGLVYHWGVSRIILLGYDMQYGPNLEVHHHGRHKRGLPDPAVIHLQEWAKRFIRLGSDLRDKGVEVINATRRTAITCFEQMPIDRALENPSVSCGVLQIPPELLPREHAACASGLAAAGYRTGPVPDVTVAWGGRNPKTPSSGKLIVAENGYLNGPEGPYVALAVGGHNGAGHWPAGSSERLKRLGVDFKPWRQDGGHILVCSSRGIGMQPMPKDWTAKTVAELKKHTDREIRVRPHPGNWKQLPEHPDVSLSKDLEGAWACVIWASTAGVKALVAGIPVIYTAPHWICSGAAGNQLGDIERPLMPERQPVFERLASAQWTLPEIENGDAFRALLERELTVLCVLKSGGDYDAEYVRKLRDGVKRNLTIPHRFVCLSDVPVPCERIPLKHGWPGWWSKIEVFRPDVITGPTLYLDLDTIITGKLDPVMSIPYDFAMLNIRAKDTKVGNSGAMWFKKPYPNVYERFVEKPQYWIDYHVSNAHDRYMGDQAFISDCFETIPKLHHALPGFFLSYKYDKQQQRVSAGCSVVCFGGHPRPHEARGWAYKAWV
jgi:hypothetical protein